MFGISPTSQNISLLKNIFGSYLIKGLGLLCSVLSMPLYIQYFHNNMILGVWFTMLSVLNWVLILDLGIGNGLRNHLTKAMALDDKDRIRELISSAYGLLGIVTLIIACITLSICHFIPWNKILNISYEILTQQDLERSVQISLIGILCSFFFRIISSILFALQKSAATNLIGLGTQLLILLYLWAADNDINNANNLCSMSVAFALAPNITLLVSTLWIFIVGELKKYKPRLKYFKFSTAKDVLSLGLIFLSLQILYLLISVTDSWFITKFYSPESSVSYQIYYKAFTFLSTLFMLAMAPLWSAITKAQTEKRFSWILRLQNLLYRLFILLAIGQIIMVFVMPYIFHIWLGKENIGFDYTIAFCFAIYSVVFTWVSIHSTFASGLGLLKIQTICYSLAVVIKLCLILCFHNIFDNWIFVVLSTCIALLPYSFIQPLSLRRHFIILSKNDVATLR